MFTKIMFHRSPKVFYEIKLTVEFWEENTKLPGHFNGFLNKRLLSKKVRLMFESSGGTT